MTHAIAVLLIVASVRAVIFSQYRAYKQEQKRVLYLDIKDKYGEGFANAWKRHGCPDSAQYNRLGQKLNYGGYLPTGRHSTYRTPDSIILWKTEPLKPVDSPTRKTGDKEMINPSPGDIVEWRATKSYDSLVYVYLFVSHITVDEDSLWLLKLVSGKGPQYQISRPNEYTRIAVKADAQVPKVTVGTYPEATAQIVDIDHVTVAIYNVLVEDSLIANPTFNQSNITYIQAKSIAHTLEGLRSMPDLRHKLRHTWGDHSVGLNDKIAMAVAGLYR